MISAFLLMAAIAPMIAFIEFTTLTQQRSQLAITATNLANEEMEKVKGMTYDSVGLVGSAQNPGTMLPEENVRPLATVTATFTIDRTVSWYPSADNKQTKKVTVTISMPGRSRPLATLTNYYGRTTMMPFNKEPLETVPPSSVYLLTPYDHVDVTEHDINFTASAEDAEPGRIMMVKYFIKNRHISTNSFYGYRTALYKGDEGYAYASTLDVFDLADPEPPLPDGIYDIFVQAIDTSGNSANSQTSHFHLRAPPDTPLNFTATFVPVDVDVKLSWMASKTNDLVKYEIWRRKNMGSSDPPDSTPYAELETTDTVGPISFVDADISTGHTYRYKVRARDVDTDSDPSPWTEEVAVVVQ